VPGRSLWFQQRYGKLHLYGWLPRRALRNHCRNDQLILFRRMRGRSLWFHSGTNYIRMFWALSRRSVRNNDRFDNLYCVCGGAIRSGCGYDRFGLYGSLRCWNLVGGRCVGLFGMCDRTLWNGGRCYDCYM